MSFILKVDTLPKFKDPAVSIVSCCISNYKIKKAFLDLGLLLLI